jgi:FAD synthase
MNKFDMYCSALTEGSKTHIVWTIGRFNPMTRGHEENIKFAESYAKKNNADFMLFTTTSHDSKKNPLTFEDKIAYLKRLMQVPVSDDAKLKTPFQILEKLGKKYPKVTFIVGEDRVEEFEKQMSKYTEQWGITDFKVVKSGNRTEGVSGTAMRNFVSLNKFKEFKDNLPSTATDSDAKELFDLVKQGMKIL